MTDTKPSITPIVISDPDNISVTFVNDVAGSGFLNGVVNLTLATARFMPSSDGKVIPDVIIASRLRMDLVCATQLRNALDAIISQHAKNGKTEH